MKVLTQLGLLNINPADVVSIRPAPVMQETMDFNDLTYCVEFDDRFYSLSDLVVCISEEDAEKLFKEAKPSSSVSDNDKKYWASEILAQFNCLGSKIEELAKGESEKIKESYGRVRKAIKGEIIKVAPILPADVLSISILLPEISD